MRRRGFLAGLAALVVAPRLELEKMGREAPAAPPEPIEHPPLLQRTLTSYGSFPANFSSNEIRKMLKRGHL